MKRQIGIMGGTFDPIHNGHLRMGRSALEELKLDEIWFMPTGTPAYKSGVRSVTPKEHRVRMTELAIREYPWARCSCAEVERCGNTYTADTLTVLAGKYPDVSFYYIVGADSLDYMDRWYHPEIIFANAVIAVAMRSTQSRQEVEEKRKMLIAQYHAKILLLQQEEYDVSSTLLRKLISEGKDVSSYMPEVVSEYIREHALYKKVLPHYTGKGGGSLQYD